MAYLGGLNSKFQPTIELEIRGGGSSKKIRFVIDTGYTGHLSVGYQDGFPLGLTLIGIEVGSLANGAPEKYLACRGKIKLGEEEHDVPIDVCESGRSLLGTAFLREFGLCLRHDIKNGRVELS